MIPDSHTATPPRRVTLRRVVKIVFSAIFCLSTSMLLIGLTYAYVIKQGPENISGRYDVYRYYAPQSFYMDHAIHHGEFPLWNMLTYCGAPFAANPQTFALYPPNLIRSVLNTEPTPFKTQTGMVIMLGLHFVVMFLGVYLLARAHALSMGGAFTAAIAFTMSALMIRRAAEFHFVTTLTWIPLLLYLAKKVLDRRDLKAKIRMAGIAGVVLALSILGGFTHILPYLGVVLVGYSLWYRIFYPKGGEGAPKAPLLRAWLNDAVAIGVIVLSASLIAAVLLVPMWELAGFAAREKGSNIVAYSDLLKQTPTKLYQDVVLYAGIKYEAEALRGSGIIALVLVAGAFTSLRLRRTLLFTALYLMLLDCSLGPPGPTAWLVNLVTPFEMSAYSRAYDVALLPLSMLAGIGADAVAAPIRSRWGNAIRTLLLLGIGLALLIPLGHWITPRSYLRGINLLVLIVPCVALGVILMAGHLRWARAMPLVLAALIFAETYAWNRHYVPYLVGTRFTRPANMKDGPQSIPQDNSRGTDSVQVNSLFTLSHIMNGYDPLHLRKSREVISGPPRDRYYYRAVRSWEPTVESQRGNLFLKRPFWLARQWVRGRLPAKSALFPAATTVFLEEPGDLGGVPEVRREALPKSAVSKDVLVSPVRAPGFFNVALAQGRTHKRPISFNLPESLDGQEAGPAGAVHSVLRLYYTSNVSASIDFTFVDRRTRRIQQGKKNFLRPTRGKDAFIEVPLPDFQQTSATIMVQIQSGKGAVRFTRGEILSDKNDEDGLIRILSRRINSVEVEVRDLKEPRILTFLDADYPGWKAFIDSKRVPIHVANDAFKAVVVPPGTHRILFEFRSLTLYAGAATSTLGLLGVLLCLLFLRSPKTLPEPEGPLETPEQVQPWELVEPLAPADSVEPAESVEPGEPVQPAEPAEPIERWGLVEPLEPVEPEEAVELERAEEPVELEPLELAEPVEQVELEPVEPLEAEEPPEPLAPPETNAQGDEAAHSVHDASVHDDSVGPPRPDGSEGSEPLEGDEKPPTDRPDPSSE